jgi:putative copper resistance protein D
LTLGGLLFLLCVAMPAGANPDQLRRTRITTSRFAFGLVGAQAAVTGLSAVVLMGSAQLPFRFVARADFFQFGCLQILASLMLVWLVRMRSRASAFFSLFLAATILIAAVGQSHAASRLTHREILLLLTAAHHTGVAGWVGAMLFLLLALRKAPTLAAAQALARQYSGLALVSVPVLVLAGIGMSLFYVGSWQGLYGTSYGVLLLAKICLTCVMLLLGAANMQFLRFGFTRVQAMDGTVPRAPLPGRADVFLIRLRRFSETELGLGFTAILAAASMTSQPPAIDLPHDQLTGHQIVQRLRWEAPRLKSPALAQLTPPTSIATSVEESAYSGGSTSDAMDRAWSEYNHHWAGLILLAAGLLALSAGFSTPGRWRHFASNWPLLFLGLSLFILLRADPENWPLGPRPFWESFVSPDVLEHRLYAVLVACFAFFEWGVATGRLLSRRAAYVFPALFALGGAALLTHSHGLSNVQDETLADISHTSIAVLGVLGGWARWLELRLPDSRVARVAGWIWPGCLALVGLLLLDYRES